MVSRLQKVSVSVLVLGFAWLQRAEIDGEGSAWKLPLDKVMSPSILNSESCQGYEPPPRGGTLCCVGRIRARRKQLAGLQVFYLKVKA